MSSLTTIQGTDVISTSRTDINNNFSALNTDKIETSTLDTDTTLAANSDSKIATQKATKAYVDSVASPVGKSWNEYAVDAVGTDSYAISLTGYTAYTAGHTFKFKAGTANTGACSLNVNGLGAKTIKKDTSSDLATGDILANQIVVVTYDGTYMQLGSPRVFDVSTQATGILPVANGGTGSSSPVPFFQQRLPTNNTTVYNTCISGSNTDGSVIYIYEADTAFKRYQRDTYTGMYKMTHNINPTLSTSKGMIIEIGNYIYLFSSATNIVATRFLAADLTGEVTMTVPTVTAGNVTAWTDGTYAYLVSDSTNTTSRKWSVSGTTFTAVSTATCTNTLEAISSGRISSIYDGTNYYVIEGNLNGTGTGMWSIHKLADVVGTSVTTTVVTFGDADFGDDVYGAITAVIDSNRMYVGQMHGIYNATTTDTMHIVLMPITKP